MSAPKDLAMKVDRFLRCVDKGIVTPDPYELLEAKERLLRMGEDKLARECERLARRLLPNLAKDLS